MKAVSVKMIDGLNIIWAIARKDILEALRNRLAVSLLFTVGVMVFIPRLFPLIIDPPYTSIVVYDEHQSRLFLELEESQLFSVRQARSLDELKEFIGDSGFGLGPEAGLVVPEDFDQRLETGGELKLEAYINWANRKKIPQFQGDLEGQISDLMGTDVQIEFEDGYVYPELTSSITSGIMTTSSILVVIIMGIILVPGLIFDEKQTKTMDALLVSPANIGQVVMGKVLAGWFYMLLTAGLVFLVNWKSVVHWELAVLFTFCVGMFSIAVGLILGSFFQSQQDVTGWTGAIVVILLGAMLAGMMDLDLPSWIQSIIPWIPSVTLSDIFRASFSGSPIIPQIGERLAGLIGMISLLYAAVVWRIRRSDR